ncbi:MAG: Ig-like domain-containing protein [Erysipelotrichaceae bacterium]|nr:Ig-like domain-containing protein [Erysipelotrichaceae bacterium]
MKKRIASVFILLLALLLCLSGCKKTEEKTGYDLSGKTYYNTVDEYGNEEHSKVWFGKDGSFVLKDNYSGGFIESSGTWSVSENVATLEVTDTGKKIIFEIVDEDTLKLKTTLMGSLQDQVFSTTETKGSSGSSGSSSDSGFTYTNYYNISQSSTKVSRAEIHSDGSFTFIDQNDLSITEINGTYTKENDVLKMTGDEFSKGKSFEFKVKSDGTLVLQNDIGVSATGDVFSKDYKPSTSAKVPCTDLTSKHHNYWAMEGVKDFDLEVKATPSNTTDVITYTVEDEKVVTVSADGKATAVSPGETKIHIKCGEIERVVGFETRAKGPSSISFDENPVSLYLNNSAKIKAKALPETADQTLTYESSDKSVVTVDKDGNLFGVSPGNAEITVKAVNGTSAVCKVCVEGETVVFEIEKNVSVKAQSGALIPFKAYLISCYDGVVNKQDVTEYVDFHTAYTSALTLKSPGYLCASGAIFQTFDCPFYFEFSDGSSLHVVSDTFYVHIEK